jgi:hypothetical protein
VSNIPYVFRAIPDEFLTDEFLDDPKMMKLIRYILKRIRTHEHVEKIKSNGYHEIKLQPFEFIFGRDKASKETGLSDREIRTRMAFLATSSFVSKSTSSSTSSFTVYRLMTESFSQIRDQQFDQQNDQQFDHKQEYKKLKIDRKQQPPTPKGGFVVVECLKLLNLSDASRKSLQKSFSEEDLELAVRWCKEYERQGNVIDNLGAMIRFAATNKPEMPKPKKDLRKTLECFVHGETYNNAQCWKDKTGIGFTRGQKHAQANYTSKTFFQDVRSMLDSFGIEIDFKWESKVISIG